MRETHLNRYLVKLEFRYNRLADVGIEDAERGAELLLEPATSASLVDRSVKPRLHKQKHETFFESQIDN